jgi:hypothetical protein
LSPETDISAAFLSIHLKDGSQPKVRFGRSGGAVLEVDSDGGPISVSLNLSAPRELVAFLESALAQAKRGVANVVG